MGPNCAPRKADLLYSLKRFYGLLYKKEAEIIRAFNSLSRYLVDLSNIGNPYFEGMAGRIYPPEL